MRIEQLKLFLGLSQSQCTRDDQYVIRQKKQQKNTKNQQKNQQKMGSKSHNSNTLKAAFDKKKKEKIEEKK